MQPCRWQHVPLYEGVRGDVNKYIHILFYFCPFEFLVLLLVWFSPICCCPLSSFRSRFSLSLSLFFFLSLSLTISTNSRSTDPVGPYWYYIRGANLGGLGVKIGADKNTKILKSVEFCSVFWLSGRYPKWSFRTQVRAAGQVEIEFQLEFYIFFWFCL